MSKVIVGMSGGVDSSVTAFLLKRLGYDVEGVSFILWETRNRTDFSTCCSLEATNSAAETAKKLGIKHSSIDVRGEFIEKVIEPFVDAYTKGVTPNPCILCNKYIKFPFLLKYADEQNAQHVATGHYAKIKRIKDTEEEIKKIVEIFTLPQNLQSILLKGSDSRKDQSYVLYVLQREIINRLILPLGEFRKIEIRQKARDLNLQAADRPESQEICFIEDRNYFRFIEKLSPISAKPGFIIDSKGNVIGRHKGIHCYTIGQRKGLGISSLKPHYVTGIDISKNIVYVGSKEDAMRESILVSDLNWLILPKTENFRCTVKVRSMMQDRPATVQLLNEGVRVRFNEPQWAPAPGQSAVFYINDIVIGGGIIRGAE